MFLNSFSLPPTTHLRNRTSSKFQTFIRKYDGPDHQALFSSSVNLRACFEKIIMDAQDSNCISIEDIDDGGARVRCFRLAGGRGISGFLRMAPFLSSKFEAKEWTSLPET